MNENKTNINWYPGHMAKTKREIGEKLNLIDLVYEIVDARMPLSSRIEEVDNIIKSNGLIGMEDRLRVLNGKLNVENTLDGFKVSCTIPLIK